MLFRSADVITENGTMSLYNSISMDSENNNLFAIGIPTQVLIILGGTFGIVTLVGLVNRRK